MVGIETETFQTLEFINLPDRQTESCQRIGITSVVKQPYSVGNNIDVTIINFSVSFYLLTNLMEECHLREANNY